VLASFASRPSLPPVSWYNAPVRHALRRVDQASPPIRLPAGVDPVRDILYVDDFSRACRSFIGSEIEFGLYNLGGGPDERVSLRDIVRRVGAMIEIEPMIQEDPAHAGAGAGALCFQHHTRQYELGWRPWIGN
jgi:nucleoside-diphosphate-sugar epimerase